VGLRVFPDLNPRIGDVGPYRGTRTAEPPGYFFGWQVFHVSQYQCGAFARCQPFEASRQPIALLPAQQRVFSRFQMSFWRLTQFYKRHSPAAPQEIKRRVRGDPGKPVRCFLFVLELILPLQGFDKGFLSQILRVVYAAYHAVDLQENAAQMFGDEPVAQAALDFSSGQEFLGPRFISWRSVVVHHYSRSQRYLHQGRNSLSKDDALLV
jgi:hypothetical protein